MRELSARIYELFNRNQRIHREHQNRVNQNVQLIPRRRLIMHNNNNEINTTTTTTPTVTPTPTSSNLNQQQQSILLSTRSRTLIKERNLLSAFCSIFSIAVLIVSLIETRWFYLNGGGCNLNYLGVSYFFSKGHLESYIEQSRVSKYDITATRYTLRNGFILRNCTNNDILLIMRLIIVFVFFAILSSFIGLLLDTFGFMRTSLKLLRRHALFHILTVIMCLIINGFCFWITERIYEQQYVTRFKKGKKIDVQFDVSYYLVVLSSILSILATAFTLIRRYPNDEDEHINRLLDEFNSGFDDSSFNMQRSLPATNVNIISNGILQTSIPSNGFNEPPPPYPDDDTQPLIT